MPRVALVETKPSRTIFKQEFDNAFEFDQYQLCSNPDLKKVSDSLYLNTKTGYVSAAASNGVLLTGAGLGTLNQMWSYGIGKDQFQQVKDTADSMGIRLVGLEQSTLDQIDWDSVSIAEGDSSLLKDYQEVIEQ